MLQYINKLIISHLHTMKKILLILVIIAIGSTAYTFYTAPKLEVPTDTAPETSHVKAVEEEISVVEEILILKEGWEEYSNDEYEFSLHYPSTWEVQEALKPRQSRALHEISIHQKEYDIFRASFVINIFTNEENQSVQEWWERWLTEEDGLKDACVEENGDNAPCLYLRDRVENEEEVEIANQSGHMVQLFQFDSEGECNYLVQGEHIIGLCFDSANPNDANFDQNKETYKEILNSFRLVSDTLDEKLESIVDVSIIGVWESTEDPVAHKLIKENGVFEESYGGKVLISGTWEVIAEGDMHQLQITTVDGIELYTIVSVDKTSLELTYLARGNTSTYTRSN